MNLTRRNFLKIAGAAAVSGKIFSHGTVDAATGRYATIIDLTRCDGCKEEPIPRCVKACRNYNKDRFPKPIKDIKPYWPHKFYEDWSKKRDAISILTPYNWIFIQRIQIKRKKEIFIPRRCMHCDNPPCVSLCPFGALSKEQYGNTVISDKLCFGGAKCRDVCPWHIPQRQAGVGLYLKIMPKYAGGGVMYKCDLCKDRIAEGKVPMCVIACEERLNDSKAMFFGERQVIYKMAEERARNEGLYIYGDKQNSGTSTLYLSAIPFEFIEAQLKSKREKFQMAEQIQNPLDEPHNLAKYFLISAFASAFAGIVGALCTGKKKANGDEDKKA